MESSGKTESKIEYKKDIDKYIALRYYTYIEVRCIEVRYMHWGGKENGTEKNRQVVGNKPLRGRNCDNDISRIKFSWGKAAGYSGKNHRGAGLDCTFYIVIFDS